MGLCGARRSRRGGRARRAAARARVRDARVRRALAARDRVGHPHPLRPLARGARVVRARGARSTTGCALGHALLGASIAAKLYPAVFLPLAVAYAWRRRGRREALVCAALALGVVVAVLPPVPVLVAPGGVLAQRRPPALAPAPDREPRLGAPARGAPRVRRLGSRCTRATARRTSPARRPTCSRCCSRSLQVAVLVWLWTRFARGPGPSRYELAAYAAAVLTAFVALGKVLSPQFLIWLVPVVPLARRRFATALLLAALVLTQLWFPFRYWDLVREFDPFASWLVLVRDLVLVALLGRPRQLTSTRTVSQRVARPPACTRSARPRSGCRPARSRSEPGARCASARSPARR